MDTPSRVCTKSANFKHNVSLELIISIDTGSDGINQTDEIDNIDDIEAWYIHPHDNQELGVAIITRALVGDTKMSQEPLKFSVQSR
eukprot:1222867-Pleurochrysis_carterae.AAC.1